MSTPTSREVAFVTGATSGIGWATALVLAGRGAAVGVIGRNMDAAHELVERIAAAGGQAIAVRADVASSTEVGAAVQKVVTEFGGLDTVVSCAGVAFTGTVETTSEDEYRKTMSINLDGTFHVARHTIPHLLARGGGSFIAVGSDAGTHGSCNFAAYTASKHAINGLIRCMALDYGPKGIRSNVVAPGFVDTPMADKALATLTSAERKFFSDSIPIGRFASPNDIANAIAFLSSPQGRHANGAILAIDGGATSGYFSAQPSGA